jgi:hypothetical protein
VWQNLMAETVLLASGPLVEGIKYVPDFGPI